MERAVIHSDLKKQEIQPQALLDEYLDLLKDDIKKILIDGSLQKLFCPVSGEREVIDSFTKMGMHYHVSKNLGNIYLSPRPSMEGLMIFYRESTARKFWLKELWPETQEVRLKKIILPLLEWSQVFISQYINGKNMLMAEFLPNYWGYYSVARGMWPEAEYHLIDPLFDINISGEKSLSSHITNNVLSNTLDVVFLFEALDRAVEPATVLNKVNDLLKPGGLCFITCLLSSGFEVQALFQDSEIFVPPERMNILSYEGMNLLIDKIDNYDILEFSTPGVLDIPNVITNIDKVGDKSFLKYLLNKRQDPELIRSFQNFLQMNRLGTFGRVVLQKIQ